MFCELKNVRKKPKEKCIFNKQTEYSTYKYENAIKCNDLCLIISFFFSFLIFILFIFKNNLFYHI